MADEELYKFIANFYFKTTFSRDKEKLILPLWSKWKKSFLWTEKKENFLLLLKVSPLEWNGGFERMVCIMASKWEIIYKN